MSEPVEIRRNPDQSIDEICIDGGNVHIEQMDDSGWFMGVEAKDGSYWQFWFGAKNRKSHVEFRHTETVRACEIPLADARDGNNHAALVSHLRRLAIRGCDEEALALLDSLRDPVGQATERGK